MKIRRELWFGLSLMALIIGSILIFWPWGEPVRNGQLGLLMLALIVVGIMLGFPTAFTLMGMGVFFMAGVPQRHPTRAAQCDMLQRSSGVIRRSLSCPAVRVHGYLVERAELIDKLFRSFTSRWHESRAPSR